MSYLTIKVHLSGRDHERTVVLDADLIAASEGRMSVVSALVGAVNKVIYNLADEILVERK